MLETDRESDQRDGTSRCEARHFAGFDLQAVRTGIGAAIRTMYSEVLREEFPDKIAELLRQLDQQRMQTAMTSASRKPEGRLAMDSPVSTANPDNARREMFYLDLDKEGLAPLWTRLKALVTSQPQPAAHAALWQYAVLREHLMTAGKLLTTEEAERRVLIIENPGLKGQSKITGSLFAGVQLLLPGETAPAHRHTSAALRFILEGSGAYTAVDGERTFMSRGDFVITPSWTWHDHGNETSEPVIWLDGLDLHMVNLFDASFFEHYPNGSVTRLRPDHDCEVRYGRGMLPADQTHTGRSSPLLNYRYEPAREALAVIARNGPINRCHGFRLNYVNPATGGAVMPTISASLQLLPVGLHTEPYASTDSCVFVVVEGSGSSMIGDVTFPWKSNDIFVAPSWNTRRHQANEDAVLFSFSDRVAQESLGIWREHRGTS
jgi:gentisate 1,2-dioxygenase